jgi:hypothetical protein
VPTMSRTANGTGRDDIQDAGQDAGQDKRAERVTVAEAAERLEITKEAVRKRISRGTLRSDRDPDGTVYVYVPPYPTTYGTPGESGDLLYREMRDRIESLERQVEEEREARRRADTLLAQLMQRIPELEPSQEPPSERPGAPETAASPDPRERPFTEEERPQEAAQPRPWWRRMFGA